MSSKIDVSRELAGRLIKGDASKGANSLQLVDAWKAMDELRAILAAPVVERQPLAYVLVKDGEPEYENETVISNLPGDEFDGEGSWKAVFITPPELAELQATIARLTAENERIERNRDMWKAQVGRQAAELEWANTEAKEWKDTVKFNEGCWSKERGTMIDNLQAARAEIERLKGGQGEPFGYWLYPKNLPLHGRFSKPDPDMQSAAVVEAFDITPLYTSQPTPVSVVLPSVEDFRNIVRHAARQVDLIPGANYHTAAELAADLLLDKVKELNQ